MWSRHKTGKLKINHCMGHERTKHRVSAIRWIEKLYYSLLQLFTSVWYFLGNSVKATVFNPGHSSQDLELLINDSDQKCDEFLLRFLLTNLPKLSS